eukprot:277716-Pyramimonas_sp.AAC.1
MPELRQRLPVLRGESIQYSPLCSKRLASARGGRAACCAVRARAEARLLWRVQVASEDEAGAVYCERSGLGI